MNKRLLEHSHTRWFTCWLWLLWLHKWQSSMTETIWPTKLKTFAIWPSTGNSKSLPTLVLDPFWRWGLVLVPRGDLGCGAQAAVSRAGPACQPKGSVSQGWALPSPPLCSPVAGPLCSTPVEGYKPVPDLPGTSWHLAPWPGGQG